MSIFSVLGKIISTTVQVIGKLLPLMEVLKTLIPSLQDEVEKIEDLIDQGGEVADDFVDQNMSEFLLVRDFAYKLELAGAGLKELIDQIISAAADDQITPEEVQGLYEDLRVVIDRVVNTGAAADKASEAIQKLNNA